MISFIEKVKKAIRNPKLAFQYVKRRGWKQYRWQETGGSIKQKHYKVYTDYLEHQKSKLDKIKNTWLPDYDVKYREVLKKRLMADQVVKPGSTVLCLAARIGTEVKSFLDLGCFAVGTDLNPGIENKYVVYGDFHDLQFANQTVDIVFTNSLDHAFDLPKLISEARRVLKPNGYFIIEAMKGEAEGSGGKFSSYESLSWKSIADLLEVFARGGFQVIKRSEHSEPYGGEHIVLGMKKP